MARFAIYDVTTGDVRGIYNGPEDEAALNTGDGQAYLEVQDVPPGAGKLRVEDGALVLEQPEPAPVPASWEVTKLIVVERLNEAGLLRVARAALKLGRPDSELTDAELLLRDRWEAARVIASDDAEARGLFTAIGADPDEILAR